jgi:hypothetical protein
MGFVEEILALLGGRTPSHSIHVGIVVYLAAWSCKKGRKDSGLSFAKDAVRGPPGEGY